jgi:glycosyltransferase involved in cell wall biosynthesis
MPLTISVVIPYYNDSQFIDDAVASVLAQTRLPDEVIIVDDCSRPAQFEYLHRSEGSCIIVRSRVNMGLAGARNAGVARAKCGWIALLDSDDWWAPTELEKQLAYVERHPECVALHTAVRRWRGELCDRLRPGIFPCSR